MPQGGGNSADPARGKRADVSLVSVAAFLNLLTVLCGALLVISLVGLLLTLGRDESAVLYLVCVLINLLGSAGSHIGARLLEKKDRALDEKEQNNARYDQG